jgi:hypothetical protein
MLCIECKTELLSDIYPPAKAIRCASCGSVASRNHETAEKANRLAWRSLWLGLSSILLLCFTGIPAVWFGIRSLLQMRFTQKRIQDQRAATFGIALGVIFGVMASVVVFLAALMSIVISWTVSSMNEANEVANLQENIGRIDLPEGIVANRGRSFKGQFLQTTWVDSEDSTDDRNCRIRMVRSMPNAQVGKVQLTELRDASLGTGLKTKPESEISELEWRFCGEPTTVVKTVMQIENEPSQLVRYVAKFIPDGSPEGKASFSESSHADDCFGIAIVVKQPGRWDEEDVRAIIESFQPAEL